MIEIFSIFSPELFIFCVILNCAVLFTRKIVERLFKKQLNKPILKEIWREYILVIMPSMYGCALLLCGYPYPEFITNKLTLIVFGIFCGLISNHIYSKLKHYLKKETDAS